MSNSSVSQLGLRFSEIPQNQPVISAPVIQHPEQPDVPAYKVAILQPAPSPLPPTTLKSSSNTPAGSVLPTPRSEPTPAERILTVQEVTTTFIKSLVQSAQDFLGKVVDGAVISVPSWFDDKARTALESAAHDAGVKVLQLLDEASAGSLISVTSPTDGLGPDRTALLVDLGQSSLTLSLLSFRHGLIYSLASSNDSQVGGEQIDLKLLKFFAKEFTKKLKTPLQVCPAGNSADERAEAKLRLAIEHTKRTLSASPGAASCSVESLKDGFDFTGSVSRMRFDMEVRTVYEAVVRAAITLLESIGYEPLHVDEIIYVGGSASLPGLDETFFAKGFPESVITPFTAGTAIGGGPGDPTTILARGCALQAKLLAEVPSNDIELLGAFERGSLHACVHATAKSLGLILPSEQAEGAEAKENALGGTWVLGVPRETPLPYRRIVQLDCNLGSDDNAEKRIGFELWEVDESVQVEKVKSAPLVSEGDGSDEEDEEEDEEIREKIITKHKQLHALTIAAKHARKEKGRWKTHVEVQFVVGNAGGIVLTVWETSSAGKGQPTTISVPPVSQS